MFSDEQSVGNLSFTQSTKTEKNNRNISEFAQLWMNLSPCPTPASSSGDVRETSQSHSEPQTNFVM